MSFASERKSLMEIQNQFFKALKHVTVISDLQLSEEDYRYLATKVKMLFKFSNDNNVVEDYKLSIVVYWVFSMRYWDKQHLGILEMETLFEGLPQYKKRYYIDICMEAFDEYGIYKYHVNYEDVMLKYRGMIARHASIPKEELYTVFRVLSNYLDCNLVEDIVESIMMDLPERTQTIFCCFDDHSKQKVIMGLRNLMIDCLDEGQVVEELLFDKHPYIAREVITSMLQWCELQEQSVSSFSQSGFVFPIKDLIT